jgi:hypothetical protein
MSIQHQLYSEWLAERGEPSLFSRPPAPIRSNTAPTNRVLILAQLDSTQPNAEELTLVERLAVALGSDVGYVCLSDSFDRYLPSITRDYLQLSTIIKLNSSQDPSSIFVPKHIGVITGPSPLQMLQNPLLKRDLWDKIKVSLS